jgi:nickel-dependent lactate racemase
MLYCAHGSATSVISAGELESLLRGALEKLGTRKRVLAIPPDFTRFHSKAGELTTYAYRYYREAMTDVLPALGTHSPMTDSQIDTMFREVPKELIRVHRFRHDLVTLGRVPGEYVRGVSEGRLDYDWPAQVNKLLAEGGHDLILSLGQVVPHEVIGMANHNKNIFVGTGGSEGINKSHFLGAVYGMERIMGRADTPVRRVLDYASQEFANHLPIVYALTVVGRGPEGSLVTRGLYVGDDRECFDLAAKLSLEVNFTMVDEPFRKVVVYLDPEEFKSTWLGNKSVYRTRMAIADEGELIVLAPGVREFGEDPEIDVLIRKYGYVTSDEILAFVRDREDIRANLSAAAHLIHGSSEGRFTITYCPGGLSRKEIESVNYRYADVTAMMKRYDPAKLRDGYQDVDGERIYFISNPAIGLWSHRDRFGA